MWPALLIGGIGISNYIVGCGGSANAQTVTPSTGDGGGHLVLRAGQVVWLDQYSLMLEGSTIPLLSGEDLPIKEFYFPPPHPIQSGPIWLAPPHNLGQRCTSCRATNPEVARLRYLPAQGCYLPPDYTGENPKPCGIPAEPFVEGREDGQTTITATALEEGAVIHGSVKVQVGKDPTRIAVTSPRWGDKFRQGDKNLIVWHCPECSPSDHMALTIFSDDLSSSGFIAYLQPQAGSFTWDAKTVCKKQLPSSQPQCRDLLPGYYWAQVAVEVEGQDLIHSPMASSGPFQILPQHQPAQSGDVTSDTVKGFALTGDPVNGNFFWVQTTDAGKRLVCFSPTTPVNISSQSDSTAMSLIPRDVPFGTRLEVKGTWENAHSITCNGTGSDSDAPPRLRATELRVHGSGIFGTFKKCRVPASNKACRDVSYMSLQISDAYRGAQTIPQSSQLDGRYLAPMMGGHYFVFDKPVEVKADHWTRLDIELPE